MDTKRINTNCSCMVSAYNPNEYVNDKHGGHKCLNTIKDGHLKRIAGYQPDIEYCVEMEDGTFVIGSDCGGIRVNFCPFCGKQAGKRGFRY